MTVGFVLFFKMVLLCTFADGPNTESILVSKLQAGHKFVKGVRNDEDNGDGDGDGDGDGEGDGDGGGDGDGDVDGDGDGDGEFVRAVHSWI